MAILPAMAQEQTFETAVKKNNLLVISRLAPATQDIDVRGTNGKTALMIAAKAGETALVEKLLLLGADPNAININGGTPIMFAAISGNATIIQQLIDANANIDARGNNGWSALMIAVAKGHLAATKLILDIGADINTQDIYLWTPLLRASYENRADIVRWLAHNKNVNINHQDEHGATALHHAAAKGFDEIVDILVDQGADLNIVDSFGRTPAVYAADSQHQTLAKRLSPSN